MGYRNIKSRRKRGKPSSPFELVKFFEAQLQEQNIPIRFDVSMNRECRHAKTLLRLCKGRRQEAEALIREFVKVDRLVLVTGRISTREGEAPKVIATEVLLLEKLTERFNCQLVIKVNADCSDTLIDRALASLEQFKGPTPVLLAAREDRAEVYIKSKKYAVSLNFKLLNHLKELLGESSAFVRPLNKRESD